jgi:MFS family permease
MNAFSILAVVIFALAGNFYLAVAALLFRGILGAMIYPLYNSWLVQNIEPRTRATVISMVGQSNAFGQIAGGPGVGAIGSAFSIRSAILATSFLSLPVLYLYGRIIHRGKLIPEQAEETLPAEAEI